MTMVFPFSPQLWTGKGGSPTRSSSSPTELAPMAGAGAGGIAVFGCFNGRESLLPPSLAIFNRFNCIYTPVWSIIRHVRVGGINITIIRYHLGERHFFFFLIRHKCHQSIKWSSVEITIIFSFFLFHKIKNFKVVFWLQELANFPRKNRKKRGVSWINLFYKLFII